MVAMMKGIHDFWVCWCYLSSLLKYVLVFHICKFRTSVVMTEAVYQEGSERSESRSVCSTDYAVSISLISCLEHGVHDDFHRTLSHINQPGTPDTWTCTRQPLSEQRLEWLQPIKIMWPGGFKGQDCKCLGALPNLIGRSQIRANHKENDAGVFILFHRIQRKPNVMLIFCALKRNVPLRDDSLIVEVSLDCRPFWAGAASGPGLEQLRRDQAGNKIKDRWEKGEREGFVHDMYMACGCHVMYIPARLSR